MSLVTFNSRNQLEEFGVIPLTGEACGLCMRTLCDLTEEGVKLIREFLRVEPTAEPWNSKGVKSIMLPRSIMEDLWIFANVRARKEAVFVGGYCSPNEWAETKIDDEVYRHPIDTWRGEVIVAEEKSDVANIQHEIDAGYFYIQRWYKRSEAPGTGLDNQHMMSGRIQ